MVERPIVRRHIVRNCFIIVDNSISFLGNPRLNKVHNVLLDLNERPEPTIEDYFEADIYIAPNLAKNSSKKFILADSVFSRERKDARSTIQGQQDADWAVSGRHERANGRVQGIDQGDCQKTDHGKQERTPSITPRTKAIDLKLSEAHCPREIKLAQRNVGRRSQGPEPPRDSLDKLRQYQRV